MKKLIAVLVVLVVIIAIVAFPYANDQFSWVMAQRENTSSAFRNYLDNLPSGMHADDARKGLDLSLWAEATKSNNIESYRKYMDSQSGGIHSQDAVAAIDGLEFDQAKAQNTIAAFQQYLGKEQGRNVAGAKAGIELIRWQQALSAGTGQALMAYLDAYPSAFHSADARAKLRDLNSNDQLFLAAQQKATFQAYQAFVHDFPGHRRANDAKKEMRRLGKAIVQVAYDHSVRGQPPGSGSDSGYNLGNEKPNTQHYEFNITFSETGGRSGYTLELTDFHIIDENGNQWGDGRTDTLTVKPGDKFVYNYWCNVEFTSATYHATWDGQDDVGNPIHCEQSIRMIRKR